MRRTTVNVITSLSVVLLAAAGCRDAAAPEQKPSALLGGLTGDLTVTTATTGSSLDPDGYTITVDLLQSQSVATNGRITFSGLLAGPHVVAISGVAANCTVSGGTTRTALVALGGTVRVDFAVSCASAGPQTGDLAVTTATSGSNLDPDGYTVTVDGGASQTIGTNGSVTFTGLAAGSHTVVLSGVAGNCTVSGGTSRTVIVPSGGTESTSFAVSCVAQTGNLTVTTSTTGSNLDPDGYTVTVDGGAASQPIATNGSVTFTGPAGDHTVLLSGVAANCAVSGANPRTITVPAGGTASTTFSVTCTAPSGGRVTGQGQVGTGSPTPGNNVQTFDFDIRADLTGRFTGTDYGDLHPGGVPATLTTDPASDPATSFTAFRSSSSVCSDPSRGVEVDGVGREDTGGLVNYTLSVCDNGPAGSGTDYFDIFIPSEGFRRSGTVTSGDIVKS
jgi:hypothetical protein